MANKDRLDIVIPMMYDIPILLEDSVDIAEEMIKISKDYFEDKVTTSIGISVGELEYSKFTKIVEQVKDKEKEDQYFNGICAFGNHLYPDWKSFKGGESTTEKQQTTTKHKTTKKQKTTKRRKI